jgi:hypothetical protein
MHTTTEWPQVLTSPLAWKGSDFDDSDTHILRLNESDIREIEHALQAFKSPFSNYSAMSYPFLRSEQRLNSMDAMLIPPTLSYQVLDHVSMTQPKRFTMVAAFSTSEALTRKRTTARTMFSSILASRVTSASAAGSKMKTATCSVSLSHLIPITILIATSAHPRRQACHHPTRRASNSVLKSSICWSPLSLFLTIHADVPRLFIPTPSAT